MSALVFEATGSGSSTAGVSASATGSGATALVVSVAGWHAVMKASDDAAKIRRIMDQAPVIFLFVPDVT
jgi:hypothetical protein